MTNPATNGEAQPHERRTILGLSGIYLLRLLGMYMVLPVLSLHAAELEGHTPLLVGLSVGAYGLAQAGLQIPFGIWSDRYGRRRVIAGGLLVFAVGSIVAALSDNALQLVIGRTLQGAGGVSAAVVALIADVSRPSIRTRAMAALGMSVGVAFTIGMIAGPGLAARFGVPFLFWLTAALSVIAAIYVVTMIPKPPRHVHDASLEWTPGHLDEVLHHPPMLRLDIGAFLQHSQVTTMFVVGPGLLAEFVPRAEHGKVYLVLVPVGLSVMMVSAFFADRWGRLKHAVMGGSLSLLGAAAFLLAGGSTFWATAGAIGLTIVAVAVAEPAAPAMLTRLAKDEARGTAAGTYAMAQFTGSFAGGLIGSFMLHQPIVLGVFLAVTSTLWLIVAIGLPRLPAHR
ncbi:MAG TPA: MFS transporter [Candidatus Krumholzibacteria bacterium]|nr:MFS transporter [Candidatus Krumholzibacteria bacterium]